MSTGTEIITSVFRWWEELMQYMLRVISDRAEKCSLRLTFSKSMFLFLFPSY